MAVKKILTNCIYISVSLSLLLLSACSGGDGGDSSGASKAVESGGSSSATTLSGVVADGYLSGARVFLDRNGNLVYDNGEPMALSTAGGSYTLDVNPGDGDLYPVVVEVLGGETVDEDNGSPVVNNYFLASLPGKWQFVSPLTTLVKLESDKNPSLTVQEVEIALRNRFGINGSVSLFSDYITVSDGDTGLIDEYARTHKAAQVIAGVMGGVWDHLTQNLGGQIAPTEQRLAAYIVADQISAQADLIEQALNDERNQGMVADVSLLIGDINQEIDTDLLNEELLSRYEQRLEQDLEVWDMQPPQLLTQSPPASDTASIDAVIVATFDEPLDETLLTNGIIELIGPNGTVDGSLAYDAENIRLSFTPGQLLSPFSSYQVRINKILSDSLGNPLSEDIVWTFTTIFDQTPPALPDF
jgi:hypothetical protein